VLWEPCWPSRQGLEGGRGGADWGRGTNMSGSSCGDGLLSGADGGGCRERPMGGVLTCEQLSAMLPPPPAWQRTAHPPQHRHATGVRRGTQEQRYTRTLPGNGLSMEKKKKNGLSAPVRCALQSRSTHRLHRLCAQRAYLDKAAALHCEAVPALAGAQRASACYRERTRRYSATPGRSNF